MVSSDDSDVEISEPKRRKVNIYTHSVQDGVCSDVVYIPGVNGCIKQLMFPKGNTERDTLLEFFKTHYPDYEDRFKVMEDVRNRNQTRFMNLFYKKMKIKTGFRLVDVIGNGLCGWYAKALVDNKRMDMEKVVNFNKYSEAISSDLVTERANHATCVLRFSSTTNDMVGMDTFTKFGQLSAYTVDADGLKYPPKSYDDVHFGDIKKVVTYINTGGHWILLAPPNFESIDPQYYGDNADNFIWDRENWERFLKSLQPTSKDFRDAIALFFGTVPLTALFSRARFIGDLPVSF